MSNILILGAGSDIAAAIARKFAERGDNITLASRNLQVLENMAADLEIRYDAKIEVARFDALETDTHADFYAGLKQRPDTVVCAFGYLGEQAAAQDDFSVARRIIDTNYTGAVSILEIVAADLTARGGGAIIGIGSVAGDRGRQSNYIYGSAKGAFAIYLAGLRNRLAKAGVHVMTVKPGFVDTKMTAGLDLPVPLTAQPDQVAAAVMKGLRKRRNTIYSLWIWRYVMLAVRSIPEFLFKRLSM